MKVWEHLHANNSSSYGANNSYFYVFMRAGFASIRSLLTMFTSSEPTDHFFGNVCGEDKIYLYSQYTVTAAYDQQIHRRRSRNKKTASCSIIIQGRVSH